MGRLYGLVDYGQELGFRCPGRPGRGGLEHRQQWEGRVCREMTPAMLARGTAAPDGRMARAAHIAADLLPQARALGPVTAGLGL